MKSISWIYTSFSGDTTLLIFHRRWIMFRVQFKGPH